MPAGRPTKYEERFCDMIVAHMSEGLSKEAFAGVIGVDKGTIYNWAEKHEEFFNAIKRGEAACRLYYEKAGRSGMQGEIDGFNATTWVFNMKNRFHEEWRDRHEHTGQDGGALVIQIVKHSDE